MNFFKVEITSPQKKWVFDEVISCTAPGTKGSLQILINHAPLLNKIEIGEVKLETESGMSYFSTSGGFLEVLDNNVSLLLETCEEAKNIDVRRAEQAAERAKNRLKMHSPDIDLTRAKIALARALNRLRVVEKFSLSSH